MSSEVHVDASTAAQARADWERRIYRRHTDTTVADPALALPAPAGLRALPGVGHVRLDWQSVPHAAGYVIERTGPDGEPMLLTHGGSDVPAVPGPPFADTGTAAGVDHRYRVGAVAGAEYPVWHWSEQVTGQALAGAGGQVEVTVDAAQVVGRLDRVWRMVGSERLTQLRFGDDGNGNHIGAEFAEALRHAHDDLGVTHVRAHAVLSDDNQVVSRDGSGRLVFDFAGIGALYDQLLGLGLRPVVELSFMPAALARDPRQTVFTYRGIISPPRDWSEWHRLVRELAAHLVTRYGVEEVATWGFEVWNEPNLEVFWSGTREEYLRLYDESARAVKSVDTRLLVGGPATAAAEWLPALMAHVAEAAVPLDFLTSHTYGNLPLDVRAVLARYNRPDLPVWWTEWGVGSTHFGPIHDGVSGAPFVLRGFAAAQSQLQALAYWVISDHFEELGRPPALFHNGFGLLTVGNLRKPRYWAVHLAAHQGEHLLPCQAVGDGAEVLVQAWATRHDDGTVDVLVWNGTINAELHDGDPRLDREISLTLTGLGQASYQTALARVDATHSNIAAAWSGDGAWPDAAAWEQLRAADTLDEQSLPLVEPSAGTARLTFALPLPGVARIRLTPSRHPGFAKEETTP